MKRWQRGFAPWMALLVAGCASPPESPEARSASRPLPARGAQESERAAAASVPIALRNPGFEDEPNPGRTCPIGWDCTMHANPAAFRFFNDEAHPYRGKRSLCIEPVKNEPWAIASQGIFDLSSVRGSRVRFSIVVRVEDVVGAGAGPYVVAQGAAGAVIAHAQRLVQGTQDWQRVAVDLVVPGNATVVEVGVSLEGRGRACLDDARLELLRD